MQKLTFFWSLLIFTSLLNAQGSLSDIELKNLSTKLVQQINALGITDNIALADFVDENDEPSKLGRYLAEELSYMLVNEKKSFKVIDRTHLRTLLKETGLGEGGMINPATVQKLGKVEGIELVLYGKLIPAGNYIKVYIKLANLANQAGVLTSRGQITRTPTIDSFTNSSSADGQDGDCPCANNGGNSSKQSKTVAAFQHQNIRIDLQSCQRNGNIVDCSFSISSLNRNDNFFLATQNSTLVDSSGKSYRASGISMNGRASGIKLAQPLSPNQPVKAVMRFANIPFGSSNFSALNLSCSSHAAFEFKATFSGINIH